MKYALGVLWLVLAYAFQKSPAGRRLFSYAGPILALAHAGALSGGLLCQRLFDRRSVEGGVSMTGFLIGLVAGVLVGALAGGAVSRSTALYWLAQIAAAGFIVFLPLFRV